MTPYGIVYKDNLFALEHSCDIWQKRFGVLKSGSVIKVTAILSALALAFCAGMSLINSDEAVFYISTGIIMAVIFLFLYLFTNKNIYVKQIAKSRLNDEQKQAVLYDDKIILTTPYTKSEYYYDEVLYYENNNGILTLIFDAGAIPVSVYFSSVGKGDFKEFSRILDEKMRQMGKAGSKE